MKTILLLAVVIVNDGSGVCVHPSGIILTAKHVLQTVQKVTIDNKILIAKILAISPESDGTVVLKVEAEGLDFIPIAKQPPFFNYPTLFSGRFGNSKGVILKEQMVKLRGIEPFLEYKTTALVKEGQSGGPLIQNDKVVGLISNHSYEKTGAITYFDVLNTFTAQEKKIIVFGTVHCRACMDLKKDYKSGKFEPHIFTFLVAKPEKMEAFNKLAKPEGQLLLPIVWVEGTDSFTTGYGKEKREGGLLTWLVEIIADLGELWYGKDPASIELPKIEQEPKKLDSEEQDFYIPEPKKLGSEEPENPLLGLLAVGVGFAARTLRKKE